MHTKEQLKAENKKLLEDREILLKRSVKTITKIEELEKKLTVATEQLQKIKQIVSNCVEINIDNYDE